MTTLRRHIISLFLLMVILGTTNALSQEQSPSIVGVYEYMLEGREGMSVFTKNHVIWILADKGRTLSELSTTADSANAFATAAGHAGTYEIVGPSTIKIHRIHSTNPNFVGRSFAFQYEFDGDVLKYWVLRPDGTRGSMGSARKIGE